MKLFTLISAQPHLQNISTLLARIGLSAIFLLTGFSKIEFFDATAQYMASVGLPEFLLPFVIAFEIVGGLFILALFLSPLAATIPNFATAPALLFVGCLMMRNITSINWSDYTELIPSLITVLVIPYTLSIADGVGAGILSYTILKIICRKRNELNATLIVLSLLFIFYFLLQMSLL